MDKQKTARMFRCKAVTKYLGYWLTTVPSEKRKLLDECLDLAKNASTVFWDLDNKLEFARTYNELSLVFWFRTVLEWDRQTLKSIVENGIKWGERTLEAVSELHDPHEIARTYFTLATCLNLSGGFLIEDLEEQEKLRLRIIKDLKEAVSLSEKVGDAHLEGLANILLGELTGGEERKGHYEKTLEFGKLTRDNFLIGTGLDYLAYVTYWKAEATEEPDKRRELYEEAMRLYDEGQYHYSIMSFMSPRGGAIGPPVGHAQTYLNLARLETDPPKRREFLKKAEKTGIEALRVAEDSDMWWVIVVVFHVMSLTLVERTHLETDPAEKRNRLGRALKYRQKSIQILEELEPLDYLNLGVYQAALALIKSELADIQSDPESKRRLLEESVLSCERSLELCNKQMPTYERIGEFSVFVTLRMLQDRYATLLMRLYDLTGKQEHLRKAIQISQKAIESANKLGLISLMAESYWKIAKAQDNLEEHLEAAKSFERASEGYAKAAEKIPQLKDFYEAQASYMRAWSEIEKARHHHERQEYDSAREHFEKAADLHKSLKHWSYLAPNYVAWAELERAEELSRAEQDEEARRSFEQVARLFDETRKSIQSQFGKIEDADEERMATNVLKATGTRHEYCEARIAVEEAKILDKKGDHYSSSTKYGSAAESFQKIDQGQESEQEKREIQFIAILSRAWQKMTMAEAEASPTLYAEASGLFEQARDYVPSEKTKMLVLGHSRFCKALGAGARFVDTRDVAEYERAMQYVESASGYYLKADFKSASDYVKATRFLFDAYVQMGNAARETDLEKKSRLYMVAEKILQASADSYAKAGNPSGREQAFKLLETAKEQRELTVSLAEVLHAPIMTSTTAFATPSPNYLKRQLVWKGLNMPTCMQTS